MASGGTRSSTIATDGAAFGGLAQQVPGHGVGVAGGGGDEQPQVGGGEQLGGQLPVGPDDRVDVGGVQQRQPGGQRGRGDQPHGDAPGRPRRPACRRRTGGAGQARAGSGSPANQPASAGWWTSTGERVVGRSTPLRRDLCPTRELTSVDLPAPVEPPTTASSGASSAARRGQDVVVELLEQRGLRAPAPSRPRAGRAAAPPARTASRRVRTAASSPVSSTASVTGASLP